MDTHLLWTRGQLDGHDPSSQNGQTHPAPPPQTRAPEIMATTLTVTLVCALIVGIRLFTRFYVLKSLALDDWLIVVATCLSGILTGTMIQKKGLGMHTHDLNMAEMSHMMLGLFWGFIVYNLALGVTKISIVFSYLRVFASTKRTRIACLVTLGLLIANTFQAVLTSVLSCNPVWLFWHPEKALLENPPMRYEDHCLNLKVMWFFQGAINIVFDFVLIVLPMPVLKSLRISRRERYALMSIFALGGFGCIVSFLRLRSLHKAASSKDAGWDNVNSVRWSVIEVTVGIMCASLPQCKALITRLFPRWLPGGHRPPTMRNVAVSNYDKGHDESEGRHRPFERRKGNGRLGFLRRQR
ncbi:integral membrane protein [Neofusicoccum parvum]|nr:integral membrane protein [Neofusicoccum parvum]